MAEVAPCGGCPGQAFTGPPGLVMRSRGVPRSDGVSPPGCLDGTGRILVLAWLRVDFGN